MDYHKIYHDIVERAKNRKTKGYTETHHITPRCIGGTDDPNNLVVLTAKEHFICHKLLCEMYPKEDKLVWGYWMMAKMNSKKNRRDYRVGAREYQRLREEYSRVLKKRVPWNKGLTKDDQELLSMQVHQDGTKDLQKMIQG